ncbi:Hypothetical predicted protein, partial [Prunus dulcis]
MSDPTIFIPVTKPRYTVAPSPLTLIFAASSPLSATTTTSSHSHSRTPRSPRPNPIKSDLDYLSSSPYDFFAKFMNILYNDSAYNFSSLSIHGKSSWIKDMVWIISTAHAANMACEWAWPANGFCWLK